MLVLGIESSTPVASVAIVSEQGIMGEFVLNIGLTHSEQLLPLIDDLIKQVRIDLKEIEGIAVGGGPGSFTGLRIGMATAKGLAQGCKVPLVSISTLRILAGNMETQPALVAPVMNARKQEVYTALYRFTGKGEEELFSPRTSAPETWARELLTLQEPVILLGDGVPAYLGLWQEILGSQVLITSPVHWQIRASHLAWLGRKKIIAGETADLYSLKPVYLRPAEAEARLLGKSCSER